MSATLVARRSGAVHGATVLYDDLDLVVAPGDVIGLVGVNGAGKSTLLRQLAGLARPRRGAITATPPAATVGYLAQEPERVPGETVSAFLARRTGVADARQVMDAAAGALSDRAPGADDAYAAALERWLDLGGADFDDRVAGGGRRRSAWPSSLDALMTSLSGGEAARAGAGRATAQPLRRRTCSTSRPTTSTSTAWTAGAVRHRASAPGW